MRRALACTLAAILVGTLVVFDVLGPGPAVPVAVAPTETSVPLTAAAAAAFVTPDPDATVLTQPVGTHDFSVMGVTWDASTRGDVQVEVRVREDDGWTAWTPLQTNDAAPHPGTEEAALSGDVGSTEPLVTPSADALQVRVSAPGGLPEGLEAVVIDPGTSPTDGSLSHEPLTGADAAAPAVVSRQAWGADESRRRCSPSYSSTVLAATVHHTAGANGYARGDAPGIVRGIYAYHTGALGWCDVGYNFLVDRFGTVYEGRYGGITKAVRGAHAGGFNDRTFGVSAMGNYETAAAPEAMVEAIGGLIGWRLALAGRNPAGTVTLTSAGGSTSRYPQGRAVSLPAVFAHRDVGSTACPGRYLIAQMPAVRAAAVKAAATPPEPTPGPTPSPTPTPIAAPAPSAVPTGTDLRRSTVVPVEVDRTRGAELLAYAPTGTGARHVLDTTASGSLTLATRTAWTLGWDQVVPVEVDGTAGSEVLLYNRRSGRVVVVDTSTSGATPVLLDRRWWSGWDRIVAVEVDGRAGSELLLYNGVTGAYQVVKLAADGSLRTIHRGTWSKGWSHLAAVEVDGSTGSELSVYSAASGRHLLVDLGTGTSGRTIAQHTWATGLQVVVPVEVDRTQRSELLTYDARSGRTLVLDVAGDGRTTALATHAWTPGWTSMSALEVDDSPGDELVVHNATSGRLLLLDSATGGGMRQLG